MTRTNRSITSLLGMGVLALAVTSVEAHQPYRGGTTSYSGSRNAVITKGERKRLAKHRQRVARVRDRALRDDQITRREARKIQQARAKLARHRARAMDNDANRQYRRDRDDRRDGWTRDRRDDRWERRGDSRRRYGRYRDHDRYDRRNDDDRYTRWYRSRYWNR